LQKSKENIYMKKQIKNFIITLTTTLIFIGCTNNEILNNSEQKPSKLDKAMTNFLVARIAQLNGDIPFRWSCNSTQFNTCLSYFKIDQAIGDHSCASGYVYQANPCPQENSVGVCVIRSNQNIYIVSERVYYSPQYTKETANQNCLNPSITIPENSNQFNENYTARYSYPPN